MDTRRNLARIVLVAFVLRLLVSLFVLGDITDPLRAHWHFGYETGRVARSLASGHGFADPLWTHTGPTAWLAPVYPLLLATIFRVFGIYSTASAIAAVTFNAVFESLTVVPLYLIGNKLFGEKTAIYCAWAWAFFPYSIYLSATWVWDTSLATLLLTTLIWWTLELESKETRAVSHWAGYGALWGLAALTNPATAAALPFLVGWLVIRRWRSGLPWVSRMATAGALCLLLLSPWLVRNYVVFHRPLMVKSNLWLEMAAGNMGSHRHWWNDSLHPARNVGELAKMQSAGELSYMAQRRSQVLTYIQGNPGEYLVLSARRFLYVWTGFWSLREEYLVDEPMDPVNIVLCTGISVSMLCGLWMAFRRKFEGILPSAFALLAVPFVYYFTHPDLSYRHPVDPMVVLFGTFAAWPVLAAAWERSLVRKIVMNARKLIPSGVAGGLPAEVDEPLPEVRLATALAPLEEEEPGV